MSLASRISGWIAARKKDFLPLSLAAGGVILSGVAIWLGATLDGKTFLLNILAALALVGPGLVLSNVLVRRFEAIRAREEAEQRTVPFLLFTHGAFIQFVEMANDFLEMASAEIKKADADATGYEQLPIAATLPELHQSIKQALSCIMAIDSSPPPAVTSMLPLPDRALRFPHTHVLLRLVEMIDREIPMPFAVLLAHRLWSYSNDVGIDFGDSYQIRSRYATAEDVRNIISPKVGFAEIVNYAQPDTRAQSKRYIGTASYAGCIMTMLSQADTLLKIIIAEVPTDILPSAAEYLNEKPTGNTATPSASTERPDQTG